MKNADSGDYTALSWGYQELRAILELKLNPREPPGPEGVGVG